MWHKLLACPSPGEAKPPAKRGLQFEKAAPCLFLMPLLIVARRDPAARRVRGPWGSGPARPGSLPAPVSAREPPAAVGPSPDNWGCGKALPGRAESPFQSSGQAGKADASGEREHWEDIPDGGRMSSPLRGFMSPALSLAPELEEREKEKGRWENSQM